MKEKEPILSREVFLKRLADVEPQLTSLACRLLPSSFNPEDEDLRAVPRPLAWRWLSLELFFGSSKRGVAVRLPLFWQVESYVHFACQSAGIPLFINEPENMPVGKVVYDAGGVDTVLTDGEDAQLFSAFLKESGGTFVPRWFIVHDIAKPWSVPEALRPYVVVEEVHLFPGMPILEQCEALAAEQGSRFHLGEEYSLEGGRYLTDRSNAFVELVRYELPVVLQEKGMCVCGKEILVRTD